MISFSSANDQPSHPAPVNLLFVLMSFVMVSDVCLSRPHQGQGRKVGQAQALEDLLR